jgi:hypothetical protein
MELAMQTQHVRPGSRSKGRCGPSFFSLGIPHAPQSSPSSSWQLAQLHGLQTEACLGDWFPSDGRQY